MTKLITATLLVAAFVYAAYLVYLRRPIPALAKSGIIKRRFLLATMIFVSFLGGVMAEDKKEITCYKPMPPKEETPKFSSLENFVSSVKAAWKALDSMKTDEFNKQVEQGVQAKLFSSKTGEFLILAYSEISHHKRRYGAACYKMPPVGMMMQASCENLEKQLDDISAAVAKKTLSDEVAKTASAAIAKELEILKFLNATKEDRPETNDIVVSEESKEAAKIIVELQK